MNAIATDIKDSTAMEQQLGNPVGLVAIEAGINFGLPILIYDRVAPHSGDVIALMASSLSPLLWSLAEFVRRRRVDGLSVLVLAGIALPLLATMDGGSAKFLQLRENLVSALIGLVFLGSAAIGKPLIYQVASAGLTRKCPDKVAAFEAKRDRPIRVVRHAFHPDVLYSKGQVLGQQGKPAEPRSKRLPVVATTTKGVVAAGPVVDVGNAIP